MWSWNVEGMNSWFDCRRACRRCPLWHSVSGEKSPMCMELIDPVLALKSPSMMSCLSLFFLELMMFWMEVEYSLI